MVEDARGKPYLVIRSFNEFSTTDENFEGGNAFTIEPNNWLHHYDGTPNAEPWYFWDNIGCLLKPQYPNRRLCEL
jgi:hypothetical protein